MASNSWSPDGLSQRHLPSTPHDLHLLNVFRGLQMHRQDPSLPYNRFELELAEPQSALHREMLATFRNAQATQFPSFDFVQLTVLALLAHPNRTATIKDIHMWIMSNFTCAKEMMRAQQAAGITGDESIKSIVWNHVKQYCQLSERNYYRTLIPKGEVEARPEEGELDWPSGAHMMYYLPYGVEEHVFAPCFTMHQIYGQFGVEWPAPPAFYQTKQQTFLSQFPKNIKLKVFSHLLAFPSPVVVHWYEDRPLVGVQSPPDEPSGTGLLYLPLPEELLAAFQVCKDFKELAEFAFYSMNTFIAHTTPDSSHPNLLRTFLSRIGPSARRLLRSLDFNLVSTSHNLERTVKDTFTALGVSYCLQRLALTIDPSILKVASNPSELPGFNQLAKFKGLQHVTVFNCAAAQTYLDQQLTDPWAAKAADLQRKYTAEEQLQAQENSQLLYISEDQIAEITKRRQRFKGSSDQLKRNIEAMRRIDAEWQGPAVGVIRMRAREGPPPILDEVALIQRPGVGKGYLGADPKLQGPGVGHGVVYDLDQVLKDGYMKDLKEKVNEVKQPFLFKKAPVKGKATPKKPNAFKSPAAKTTPRDPATMATPARTSIARSRALSGTEANSEVNQAVAEVLQLEAEYLKTMTAESAKVAALRRVFDKVMNGGDARMDGSEF